MANPSTRLTTKAAALLTILRSHLALSSTIASLRAFATSPWRILLLLFLLLNAKSLPLAWHVRIFRRFFANLITPLDVQRALQLHRRSHASGTQSSTAAAEREARTHPIFQVNEIYSRTPLLETDYNLHKSNSTYFSDLDESRVGLVTRLLIPGLRAKAPDSSSSRSGAGEEAEKKNQGKIGIYLGAVHTSFHREIAPYQKYCVRSRVLGWDRKWIVIGSWFVGEHEQKGKGKGEVLLASALSKYVVKRGRVTVRPEACLERAGWLPERPERDADPVGESAVLVPFAGGAGGEESTAQGTPVNSGGDALPSVGGERVVEVKERLERVLSRDRDTIERAMQAPIAEEEEGGWSWERIEQERLRGLKVAEGWLELDGGLRGEFEYEI